MRTAYLDCFAGISGDMLLGALLGAGVPLGVLEQAAEALNLQASLRVETVDRSGISSIKVHVLEGDHLAEPAPADSNEHQQSHEHPRHQPETQHQHKSGHGATAHIHDELGPAHAHDEFSPAHEPHPHVHGRSLSTIKALIAGAPLAGPVKELATRAFELLGHAEAQVHNVPVEQIHFHEVGAVDAIVDIVCASAGIVHLGIGAWHSSPVNVGGGMVRCAHGTFPVPAPATANLLRGVPTYSAHVQKELVTPTGAALLRALDPAFGPQPPMAVTSIGYGAGSRNPPDFPNVLRLSLGDASAEAAPLGPAPPQEIAAQTVDHESADRTETVAVLETALDDATPQLLAYVAEQALAQGALDVMLSPVVMKKGRPGTLLTLLCQPGEVNRFEQLLLTETTTLGVRVRHDRRTCLDRTHTPVDTPFGSVRVKQGLRGDTSLTATPEYEDCRLAAAAHRVPLKRVQEAATEAFHAATATGAPESGN